MTKLSLQEVLEGLEHHSFIFEDEHQYSLIVFILSSIYSQASQEPPQWNG